MGEDDAQEGWELVHRGAHDDTERLAVPGGWLYRNRCGQDFVATVTFVPDPEWSRSIVVSTHEGVPLDVNASTGRQW